MPQGKIKVNVKGGKPPAKKDKPAKKPAGVKKGKFAFAPKKTVYFHFNILYCMLINVIVIVETSRRL